MKTKSALLRSIGVLLALLVFVSLPTYVLAICGICDDVSLELYYGTGRNLYIEVECPNPTGADIYFTTNGVTPTHDGDGNPGPSTLKVASGTLVPIAYGTTIHILAIADKGYCWLDSENVSEIYQHNPNL